jgi:hypothetical protein
MYRLDVLPVIVRSACPDFILNLPEYGSMVFDLHDPGIAHLSISGLLNNRIYNPLPVSLFTNNMMIHSLPIANGSLSIPGFNYLSAYLPRYHFWGGVTVENYPAYNFSFNPDIFSLNGLNINNLLNPISNLWGVNHQKWFLGTALFAGWLKISSKVVL